MIIKMALKRFSPFITSQLILQLMCATITTPQKGNFGSHWLAPILLGIVCHQFPTFRIIRNLAHTDKSTLGIVKHMYTTSHEPHSSISINGMGMQCKCLSPSTPSKSLQTPYALTCTPSIRLRVARAKFIVGIA